MAERRKSDLGRWSQLLVAVVVNWLIISDLTSTMSVRTLWTLVIHYNSHKIHTHVVFYSIDINGFYTVHTVYSISPYTKPTITQNFCFFSYSKTFTLYDLYACFLMGTKKCPRKVKNYWYYYICWGLCLYNIRNTRYTHTHTHTHTNMYLTIFYLKLFCILYFILFYKGIYTTPWKIKRSLFKINKWMMNEWIRKPIIFPIDDKGA